MAPSDGQRHLPLVQKVAYSVGHVLNDLTASMWFTYMIIYFHKVKDFNNTLSGNLVLIGQISDAIFTPFIGFESDRVKGLWKMGKRKTWHFVGEYSQTHWSASSWCYQNEAGVIKMKLVLSK